MSSDPNYHSNYYAAFVIDPTGVTVAALESDAIGVRVVSSVDDRRIETDRWELDALDDLAAVGASIFGMLEECRVQDVRILDAVVLDAELMGAQRPALPH